MSVSLNPRPTLSLFCCLVCIDNNTWKLKSSEKSGRPAWIWMTSVGCAREEKIVCTLILRDLMHSCYTTFLHGRRLLFTFKCILKTPPLKFFEWIVYILLCACTQQLCLWPYWEYQQKHDLSTTLKCLASRKRSIARAIDHHWFPASHSSRAVASLLPLHTSHWPLILHTCTEC